MQTIQTSPESQAHVAEPALITRILSAVAALVATLTVTAAVIGGMTAYVPVQII